MASSLGQHLFDPKNKKADSFNVCFTVYTTTNGMKCEMSTEISRLQGLAYRTFQKTFTSLSISDTCRIHSLIWSDTHCLPIDRLYQDWEKSTSLKWHSHWHLTSGKQYLVREVNKALLQIMLKLSPSSSCEALLNQPDSTLLLTFAPKVDYLFMLFILQHCWLKND